MVRIIDFVHSSGMLSFIQISLHIWCSWSMIHSPPCLRSSPGISSVLGAFPCFSLWTAASTSDRSMEGSLSMSPWLSSGCVNGCDNGRLVIVQGLAILRPSLCHLLGLREVLHCNRVGCRIPFYPFGFYGFEVLKASLLLCCCMLDSTVWHFSLNHFSLSAFIPIWIALVNWLYSRRWLGSLIAIFLAFLLSSVNTRVSSQIQYFF